MIFIRGYSINYLFDFFLFSGHGRVRLVGRQGGPMISLVHLIKS
jgi:hypothetical protein